MILHKDKKDTFVRKPARSTGLFGMLTGKRGFAGASVRAFALLLILMVCVSATGAETFAQIASEDALYDSIWNYLFEDDPVNNGVIQSICSTPDYLITIENTSDDPSQPDTVSAYYKNPVDKDGNPVQQYSLAMRNTDYDWEHGNGMAYNSNTNEIYVALYSNDVGDNEGCLYVMDPDTLAFKRKIQIAEGYNILGIDYDPVSDQYFTLTNSQANFSLQRRDSSFNLIEDFGPIDPSPGTNFQDICISGDYIFLSPLTYGMGIGDFMNVYSISRRETLLSINMDMGLEAPFIEAEGVCMAHKGVFVCPVTVTRDDGSRHVYFFETTLPWFFTIETCARGMTYEGEYTVYSVDEGDGSTKVYNMDGSEYENTDSAGGSIEIGGTVSAGNQQVLSGTSYTVTFNPDPGYKVAAVYLDVTRQDVPEGATSYTIDNIDGNHRVTVDFKPTSKPTATPSPTPKADDAGDTLTDDESRGSQSVGSISGAEVSSTDQNDGGPGTETTGKKATRSKAVIFTVLILLMLVFGLGLLVLYNNRVKQIREQANREREEERRKRRRRMDAEMAVNGGQRKRRKTAGAAAQAGYERVPGSSEERPRRRRTADGYEEPTRRRRSADEFDETGRRRRSADGFDETTRRKRSSAEAGATPKRKSSSSEAGAAPKRRRSSAETGAAPKRKRSSAETEAAPRRRNTSAGTQEAPRRMSTSSGSADSTRRRYSSAGSEDTPRRRKSSAGSEDTSRRRRSSAGTGDAPKRKRSSAETQEVPQRRHPNDEGVYGPWRNQP